MLLRTGQNKKSERERGQERVPKTEALVFLLPTLGSDVTSQSRFKCGDDYQGHEHPGAILEAACHSEILGKVPASTWSHGELWSINHTSEFVQPRDMRTGLSFSWASH